MDNKCVICGKEFQEGDNVYNLFLPSKTHAIMCIEHKGTQDLEEYISNMVRPNDLTNVGGKVFLDREGEK
jgi:hypothetical protein